MPDAAALKTPDQILRAALEKERAAYDFYGEAMNHCKIDMVKDLLVSLHNEEAKHMDLIHKMLTRLNLG